MSWPRRSFLKLEKGNRLRAFTSSIAASIAGANDALWWMRAACKDPEDLPPRIDRLDHCVWFHLSLYNSHLLWEQLQLHMLQQVLRHLVALPEPRQTGWKLAEDALGVGKVCRSFGRTDLNVFFGGAVRTDVVLWT